MRQARAYTPNLRGTVEELLKNFAERDAARRQAEDTALAELNDTMNAFHLEHGTLGDAFPQL